MVAATEAMDNTVRDFQKLKTSLHRQMVDVIDFNKAEGLSESELRGQLRSLADYLCTQQSLSLDTQVPCRIGHHRRPCRSLLRVTLRLRSARDRLSGPWE